jgi:hypothetical protein
MALEPIVESLESVPESLRDEYVEVDSGQYQLKVLQGFVPKDKVEDVSGLKSALHKEREAAREAARKVRQMQEQYADFDMDEYQALREAQATAEEERAKRAGEYDSLKQQLVSKHTEEKSAWEKDRATLISGYEKAIAETATLQALAENKGNPVFLKHHVLGATKVFKDDSGRFVTRVVDDAGNPRMNSDGNYLSVSEFVRELRENETYAGAFQGAGSSGGGTPPGAGGQGQGDRKKGGIPSDLKRGDMSRRQKVEFINEFGHDEFMKLPA